MLKIYTSVLPEQVRGDCGKSTLVRLLPGFEKPRKGAVYYDNRDIETLDLLCKI